MEKEYVQKIRNMRIISDDDRLLHYSSFQSVPLGTIEEFDGKKYKVIDNSAMGIVVTYEPVSE